MVPGAAVVVGGTHEAAHALDDTLPLSSCSHAEVMDSFSRIEGLVHVLGA